jgi:predicted metal-binding membrane protein
VILESALRRDRMLVIAALAAVSIFAWAYTLAGVGMPMDAFEMTAMGDVGKVLTTPTPWSPRYAVLVYLMWLAMMIAMMLPSAAPMVLLFAAIARKQQAQAPARSGTAVFVAGYLAAWALFSAGAAAAHWGLEMTGFLTPMMTPTSVLLGGALLVTAGLYQLTPLKQACLRSCRDPIRFLTRYWRPGLSGAARMGAVHGALCLGCCWVLMLLLFFGGVMNLYWIAGIATYVLAEKLIPRARWLSHATGAALIVWGIAILAHAL